MPHFSRQGRGYFVGALALAVALSAGALTAGASGAAVPSKKVDKSAVLRVGVPLAEQGGVFFDPSNSTPSPYARMWIDLIYDTMIHATPDGQGAPGLATKWATPDPQTVELTLRSGVKFSDGAAFNAAAVKAAWDRLLASNVSTIPADVKAVTSVEAADDTTVRVKLSQPIAKAFVDELTGSFWLGVPSPAAAQAGTLNTKPVGAGPYQLDSYEESQTITLKKNPQFYNPKAQKLAGVEFIEETTGQPSVAALQGGTVDMITSFALEALQTIKSSGFAISTQPGTRVYDLGLCVSDGPFANKKARQAIQYAVDRKSINEASLAGVGTPSIVPLTPVSPYYNKSLEKTYSYNPKKAKALLKQAGVKPGTKVRALVPTNAPEPALSEIVQSQLKDVGLNLQLNQTSDFGGSAIREKPELTVVSLDPTLFTLSFSGDASALNVCGYKNADITQALTDARDASKTAAEQKAAWDKFQKLELDDSPLVWTNLQGLLAAGTTKVHGLDIINSPYGPQLNTVYMTK